MSILDMTFKELDEHIVKYAELLHKPHTIPYRKPKNDKWKDWNDAYQHAKKF